MPLDMATLTVVTHRRSPKDEYIKDVDLMTTPTDAMNPEETLYAGDNGRVVGYDNAHDGHHRHYFGVVEPIEFVSFEDVEERFEQDWIALKDCK